MNCMWAMVCTGSKAIAAQHSPAARVAVATVYDVHPIPGKVRRGRGDGSPRVFKHLVWLEAGSGKMALSRLTQQYPAETVRGITQTVGWLWQVRNLVYFYLDEIERAFYNLVKENYYEKNNRFIIYYIRWGHAGTWWR
jgi:hypothetical protein